MIRVLLVDDEPMAMVSLKYLLSAYSSVCVVGECNSAAEAIECCSREKVDAAFLDIEMPGVKGVELSHRLRAIQPELMLIFVTAYSEYAVKAFELAAQDYLLKPVTRDRLALAMAKIEQALATQTRPASDKQPAEGLSPDGSIIGKADGRTYRVDIGEVLYLEVRERRVFIVTAQREFRVQGALADWESRLPSSVFCRCHTSFIVNTKKIEYIENFSKNTYTIKLSGVETTLPLSRKFSTRFKILPGARK